MQRHAAVEQRRTYSITSSARASSTGGTVSPSALAVMRLIARSTWWVAQREGRPASRGCLGDPLAARCNHQATGEERCGKSDLDRAIRRERAEVRHLLGVMMQAKEGSKDERPSLLD